MEEEEKAEVAETQHEQMQSAQAQVAFDEFSNDPLTMEQQEDSESANDLTMETQEDSESASEEQDETETGPVDDFAVDAADKYLETVAKYDEDERRRFKHAPPTMTGMTPKVLN